MQHQMAGVAMDFEQHPGPLCKGDLIVVEIGGKLVPKGQNGRRPQWFVVLNDQTGTDRVQLQPFNTETKMHTARRYVCQWKD
jgi:hypothetical protein